MRNIIRPLKVCIELLALMSMGALLVTLRYLWKTPQPLENVLPGDPRLYKWTYGHMYYKIIGAVDAPPLVLLHAPEIGASSYEMRNLIEGLAQRYRVYAPDLLGFGLSDRPRAEYTAEMYVSLLRDFLTDVVTQPATLLASGLSCNYSVMLAASSPELCKRLILLSPATLGRSRQSLPWLTRLIRNIPISFLLYALLTPGPILRRLIARQRGVEERQVSASDQQYIFASAHQFGAEHAVFALLSGKLDTDVSQQFETLYQPTLIIWGGQALNKAQSLVSQHTISPLTRVVVVADTEGRIQEAYPDRIVGNVLAWPTEEEPEVPEVQTIAISQPFSKGAPYVPALEELPESARGEAERETTSHETVEASANVQAAEELEAYCVKCRQKRPIQNPQRVVTKNGRNAIAGTCLVCGTKLFRFIRS